MLEYEFLQEDRITGSEGKKSETVPVSDFYLAESYYHYICILACVSLFLVREEKSRDKWVWRQLRKLANTADAQQTRAVFSPFPTFLVEKDMGLKRK